jgi:DNA-directed RNA polymerase alpha subunit
MEGFLNAKIEDTDFSVRAKRLLLSVGIRRVHQLIQRTEKELLNIPMFGKKSLLDVKLALNDAGFDLMPETRE